MCFLINLLYLKLSQNDNQNYLKDLTLQDPIKNKLNEWIELLIFG